jgi:hypothetical protein
MVARNLDDVAERSRVRLIAFGFEPGFGGRNDDCARYTACLDSYASGPRMGRHHDGQARCPVSCAGFTKRDQARDVDQAAAQRDGGAWTP